MKFSEHLGTHLTPEWRKQYIDYEKLKALIYDINDKCPAELRARDGYIARKAEQFLALCDEELQKINLFYTQKLAVAESRYRELECELRDLMGEQLNSKTPAKERPFRSDAQSSHKNLRSLKLAFSEFYLSLVLLQNYQQLNATGFRKILKKLDKVLEINKGLEWRQNNVDNAAFCLNKDIDQLIAKTESTVIQDLEGGNRQAAMKRLRVPPLSEKQSPWTTFRLGLYLGCFLILVAIIIFTLLVKPLPNEPKWTAVRLYRGFLILCVNFFLVGINMYGWQSSGVNHVLIFEIDPRDHLTYQALMEISAMWGVIWALCVLGYLYHELLFVPALVWPLLFVGLGLLWILNPIKIWYRSSRSWFLTRVFVCLSAPFHFVTFSDFWLADQMNSLTTFFLDMEYFICFYSTEVDWAAGLTMRNQTNETGVIGVPLDGMDSCTSNQFGIRPLITAIPALLRFLQCLRRYRDTHAKFPHLVNAGKYSTTVFVVMFGSLTVWHRRTLGVANPHDTPMFWAWVVAYLFSTFYTFIWDVKMDWGLFDPKHGDNPLLREELVYRRRWYYYTAIVGDLVLRFAWTLNLTLNDLWISHGEVLVCATALAECLRRFMWNFFRLENEHLNNCGQFRAVRDISIRPINKGDLEDLLRCMDEPNGITHRNLRAAPSRAAKAKKRFKEQLKKLRSGRVVVNIGTKGDTQVSRRLLEVNVDPDEEELKVE